MVMTLILLVNSMGFRVTIETNLWAFLWGIILIRLVEEENPPYMWLTPPCRLGSWAELKGETELDTDINCSPLDNRSSVAGHFTFLPHEFPSRMDSSLELWDKINTYFLEVLISARCFVTAIRNVTDILPHYANQSGTNFKPMTCP